MQVVAEQAHSLQLIIGKLNLFAGQIPAGWRSCGTASRARARWRGGPAPLSNADPVHRTARLAHRPRPSIAGLRRHSLQASPDARRRLPLWRSDWAPTSVRSPHSKQRGNRHAKPKGEAADHVSLLSFPCRRRRQFIECSQGTRVELLRSLRRREGEGIGTRLNPSLPPLNPKGILWSAVHGLARDHQFARYRRLADLTQSCQSVSKLRKARCSHSLPSITPRPMCLASITSATRTS